MNLTLLDGYKWSHVVDDDEDDEDDEDDVDVFSTILHINLLGSTLHLHACALDSEKCLTGTQFSAHACALDSDKCLHSHSSLKASDLERPRIPYSTARKQRCSTQIGCS